MATRDTIEKRQELSNALRVIRGEFGRVCLLDMNRPLVRHAHHHVHFLVKAEGADTFFEVRGVTVALTDTLGVVMNAWEPHSYVHDPKKPPTIILAFYIEPAWLASYCLDWQYMPDTQIFSGNHVLLDRTARCHVRDLAQLMVLHPVQTAEHVACLSQLMMHLVHTLTDQQTLRRSLRELARGSSLLPPVRRALSLISQEPAIYSDIGALTRKVGVSRAHLYRMFEDSIGIPPKLYANAVRIERAISIVSQPDAKMMSISDDLGFSAPAHFSRFFHDHAGSYPTTWRSAVAE